MSRLHDIENKLLSINDAVFQNLCDAFLYFTEQEYPDINRSGSQKGKQKTTKGTPDSYFLLRSGEYVMVEYTTKAKGLNADGFLNKVFEDIDKCLDESKTGIDIANINKIIYCCNCSLAPTEHSRIVKYCEDRGIRIELKTLDVLAIGLLGRCAHVAKEFLGIDIDTAQILPPERFIEEQERPTYATKLSNQFVSREQDLTQLEALLLDSQIVIVKGIPGVGKTRLVLTLFENLKMQNRDACFYVVSNKNAPIYEDLRVYLQDDKDFFILIDDANRQTSNFESILSFMKETRNGNIRLVITLRDYAFNDVFYKCEEYKTAVFSLSKLSDDQITTICRSEDFNIQDQRYIDRILTIADGNPRLAVMAATIAIEKQDLMSLLDVSDLYDRYFRNTVDSNVFSNRNLLKVLGIISFFYSVNKLDGTFFTDLETGFGIDRDTFINAADQLERWELVESSSDLTVVRIGEQVLGTYFFYRIFFKEQLLDFSVILTRYFHSHFYRIKDTIVPANNTFGADNVYDKIDLHLASFWSQIKGDEDLVFRYFDLFWLYKIDDVLGYIFDKVNSLVEISNPIYTVNEKEKNLYVSQDAYLSLLSKFYHHPFNCLESAIELGFEYTRKRPDLYTQFITVLRSDFLFTFEDEDYAFYRQQTLISYLVSLETDDLLARRVFHDVLPGMMKTTFNITSGGRKRESFALYRYKVPLIDCVKKFREIVWNYLIDSFNNANDLAEGFILTYLQHAAGNDKEVLKFDLPFLLKLIEQSFSKESFVHCYLVQEIVYWFPKFNVEDSSFAILRSKYHNKEYLVYIYLAFDRLRAQYDLEHNFSIEDYQELKKKEIVENFLFNSLEEFRSFYDIFIFLNEWSIRHNKPLLHSFDIVISENLKTNVSLGCEMIDFIMLSGNMSSYVPWLVYFVLNTSKDLFKKFYSTAKDSDFKNKHLWLLNSYCFVEQEDIDAQYLDDLVTVFQETECDLFVDFPHYEKFLLHDITLFRRILTVIWKRNNEEAIKFKIYGHSFECLLVSGRVDISILKQTYLQQQSVHKHFDHDYSIFVQILRMDNDFLIEYIKHWSTGFISVHEHTGLSVVWELDNAEQILKGTFDYLSKERSISLSENFADVFFNKDTTNRTRIVQFLKDYLTDNVCNASRVNLVFNCIRHFYKEELEEFLLYFLRINPDFNVFRELEWVDNSFMSNGKTIWGDFRARQYELILVILEKIRKQVYRYSKHKELIKLNIMNSKKSADNERKRMFMQPEW